MGVIVKTSGLKTFANLKRFSLTHAMYTGESKSNDVGTDGYIPPYPSTDCPSTYTRDGLMINFSLLPPLPTPVDGSGGVHDGTFANIFN